MIYNGTGMKKQFTRQELVTMVDNVINPDDEKATEEEACHQLFVFCASCPDPVAAMKIVVETMDPLTASEMVDLALACPYRDVRNVPESELYKTHPLRYVRYGVVDEK